MLSVAFRRFIVALQVDRGLVVRLLDSYPLNGGEMLKIPGRQWKVMTQGRRGDQGIRKTDLVAPVESHLRAKQGQNEGQCA